MAITLADTGGASAILSFLHVFSPKSVHVGDQRPPIGQRPPQWKILDPPLNYMFCLNDGKMELIFIIFTYSGQTIVKCNS